MIQVQAETETWLKIQKHWEVQQLLDVLTEQLLPLLEHSSAENWIVPGTGGGKQAIGPYPARPSDGPPGEELPGKIADYQSHRTIEWVFGYAGLGELALDGRRYLVQRGDVAIIAPNAAHQERIHMAGRPYQMIWFGLYNQVIKIHASSYNLHGAFERISGATIFNCADICRLLQEATEEAQVRPRAWRSMLRAHAAEALIRIARHIEKHGLFAAHQDLLGMVDLVKSHIEQHYAEALTLKRIAQLVYLSPNYFSSLYSEATGQPVIEYIQEVRLKHACRLLKESGIPVKEVGELVGFHSSAHFTRSFKKHTGLSPSAYRQKTRG
ncbi:MAG: helix-turn-helix transcriptional regulator [Planctomycetes bacterium]|nr:helix-turn-helix transcriptional regulator [Planctomycetota bacterium]